MQISHTQIIGALTAALEQHGLSAPGLHLMPIDPPRPWGAASNACFILGKQAAAADIERETAGLDKKAAKQRAGELAKAAGEQLASEIAKELHALCDPRGTSCRAGGDPVGAGPCPGPSDVEAKTGGDKTPPLHSDAALPFIAKVEAEGAYINFYYDIPAVVGHVVTSAVTQVATDSVTGGAADSVLPRAQQGFAPTEYGAGAATGQRIMVEYAQPNTHKDFHVGHLRNASIGQAIANLLEFAGNDVLKATYIGDVGAHVAKAIWFDKILNAGDEHDYFKSRVINKGYIRDGLSKDIEPLSYWGEVYSAATKFLEVLKQEYDCLPEDERASGRPKPTGHGSLRLTGYIIAQEQIYSWLGYWERYSHLSEPQRMIYSAFADPETNKMVSARKEWNESRDQCIDGFYDIFDELLLSIDSIDPDLWFFESTVDDTKLGQKTAAELKALGIAEVDESAEYKGALYVDFAKHVDALRPDGTPVFRDDEKKRIRQLGKMTILRSDGTSLYQTKELGLAKHKFDLVAERFGAPLAESLYVVGAEQKLYFEQVFAILRLWGFPNAERCKHIAYELVVLPEGKMSSREGNIVSYRELRDEAIKRAEEITREKGIGAAGAGGAVDEAKVTDIARKIAIAAIKYAMLKVTGAQQIVFDFEEALSFSGRTAPYLQYAYARAGKLIGADGGQTGAQASLPMASAPAYTLHESEVELARRLSLFPDVCAEAAAKYEPATLCNYLYDLADGFSAFYRDCRVLDAPEAERDFRQQLVAAFRNVVRTGFTLLALPLPEEM